MVFLLIILSICHSLGSGEVYSSVSRMKEVLQAEETWYKLYHQYVEDEKHRITWMESLLEEVHATVNSLRIGDSLDDVKASEFLSHPTQVFRFINSWILFQDNLHNRENVKSFVLSIMDQVAPAFLRDDRKGAGSAILRLQHVYNLSTSALVNGIVNGDASIFLRPEDVYHIGNMAYDLEDYDTALDWLSHVVNMGSNMRLHVSLSDAWCTMARIQFRKGNFSEAMNYLHKATEFDSHNKTLQASIQRVIKEETGSKRKPLLNKGHPYLEQDVVSAYEALCRGENISRSSKLTCRYRRVLGPYHLYKEEIYSYDPRITMFYDVINDQEVDYIINKAKPKIHRAWVVNKHEGMTDDARVSQMTWLPGKSEIIENLNNKISLLTGLNATTGRQLLTSEQYQVVNYGIGGQYEPHVDAFGEYLPKPEKKKKTGDRLATFLLYLTDVKSGGATVFPDIQVSVPPVKYAAAFWYNINRSGEIDARTLHAGCPVLIGEKWIANKWFREKGQELLYPCGNLPQDVYDAQ